MSLIDVDDPNTTPPQTPTKQVSAKVIASSSSFSTPARGLQKQNTNESQISLLSKRSFKSQPSKQSVKSSEERKSEDGISAPTPEKERESAQSEQISESAEAEKKGEISTSEKEEE